MVVLRPHPTGLLTRLLLSLPPGRWTWTDMVQKTAGAFTVVGKSVEEGLALRAFSERNDHDHTAAYTSMTFHFGDEPSPFASLSHPLWCSLVLPPWCSMLLEEEG